MSARRKKLSTLRTRAGRRRRILIERLEDRRLLAVFPNDPLFENQWQLHNPAPPVNGFDADMDLPEAWAVTTGSYKTVVAVPDMGVDYTHEDLYLNIWINRGEIPASIEAALTDVDGDEVISFFDLNDPANSSLVSDINGTGYIDGGDLLNDPIWEDGIDTDGNGFVDDLVGWDFNDGDNDPHPGDPANSHGTAQAGRIGAIGNNGIGMTGINWKVSIMCIRHTNELNQWTPTKAAAYIDYTVDMGAPISSISYGNQVADPDYINNFQPELDAALARAEAAGQLLIGGAGGDETFNNDDVDPPTGWYYYLHHGNLMWNTALTNDNELYMGYGPTTISTAVSNWDSYATNNDNAYGTGGGSSSVGPLVAGVAALVLSERPELAWDYSQLKSHLMDTVDLLPNLEGMIASEGRVNAAKALGVVKTEVFADSFENGAWNGNWVEDAQDDWFTSSQRATDGSSSAEVDGRANDATLTLANPIDLSSSLSAKVSFDWFIESNWDSGESLSVDLFDGNVWSEWKSLDGNIVNEEGFWISETIELDNNYLTADFRMRFRANVSGANEDGNIDNVRVIAKQLPPAPSLSIDDQQVSEGDSGTTAVTFTVTRSGDTSGTSTVVYAIADGTATVADNDYVATSGTLEFLAGETAKTITVDVNGDTQIEPDETFSVNLSNPSSGTTISDPQGIGTIVSDDLPNQAPTADAGPDQAVTDTDGNGSEMVTLQGSGSDADGTIVGYEWTEGTTVLGNTATITPTLAVGTHTLMLTVTDNEGATGSDTVEITVTDAGQPLYVYDIRFESRKRNREWRAVFEIRTDSNGNGIGDDGDQAVANAAIVVTFGGQTFSGFTDSNGIFRTGWVGSLDSGDHYANAVDVALTGYNWNKLMGENDSDGDGYPDDILLI